MTRALLSLLVLVSARFANDPQRPSYHPIPDANWTNEPHGLVFHKGRYHLFYQKNPKAPVWDRIHWGHLSSADLLDWVEEPIALAPEPGYDQRGIWSGDCVINGDEPTIIYTGVDGVKAGICLATSSDGMKTWRKHPKNPVIATRPDGFLDFRDPHVWKDGDHWHALIGSGVPGKGGTALLYRSQDLVKWEYRKPLLAGDGTFWEMPVFVPITKDKWLLYVTTVEKGAPARGLYWIGTWKDETFTPDATEPRQLDVINHMLSPAMTRTPDGRLLAIGIIPETRDRKEQIKAGWANTFSLPRELTLGPTGALIQRPAVEIQRLHGKAIFQGCTDIKPDQRQLLEVTGDQSEIIAQFAPGTAQQFGLRVRCSPDGEEETLIYYDALSRTINIDRTKSSLNPEVERTTRSGRFLLAESEPLMLQVFLDHSVIEVFLNGREAFATRVYPTRNDSTHIGLYASGGIAVLRSLSIWPCSRGKIL